MGRKKIKGRGKSEKSEKKCKDCGLPSGEEERCFTCKIIKEERGIG